VKPRLLIVDDEPDMLDFLERVLRRRFSIARCESAEDALHALDGERFEVLITDHKMPRLSGLELLDRISSTSPEVVKVLISGFAEEPDIDRARARDHIHSYVVKPVDSQRLLLAIDEAYAVRDRARAHG
jgi:DNA-binding NtrC family response regulator